MTNREDLLSKLPNSLLAKLLMRYDPLNDNYVFPIECRDEYRYYNTYKYTLEEALDDVEKWLDKEV